MYRNIVVPTLREQKRQISAAHMSVGLVLFADISPAEPRHFLERARLQDSDVREARIAIKYLGKLADRLTRYVAKMDAVRCPKEFVQQAKMRAPVARACPGRGAYSARSISAGSIRTAWMTAGNDASSAAATIASDGSASMGRSVAFT